MCTCHCKMLGCQEKAATIFGYSKVEPDNQPKNGKHLVGNKYIKKVSSNEMKISLSV